MPFEVPFVVSINLLCLLQSRMSTFFIEFLNIPRGIKVGLKLTLPFSNKLSWPLSKLGVCSLIHVFLFAMTVVMNYPVAKLHANHAVFVFTSAQGVISTIWKIARKFIFYADQFEFLTKFSNLIISFKICTDLL